MVTRGPHRGRSLSVVILSQCSLGSSSFLAQTKTLITLKSGALNPMCLGKTSLFSKPGGWALAWPWVFLVTAVHGRHLFRQSLLSSVPCFS